MAESPISAPTVGVAATTLAVGTAAGAVALGAEAVAGVEDGMKEKNIKSQLLGYAVQEIHFGILASKDHPSYSLSLADTILRMCPDRFRVTVLQEEEEDQWPSDIHVLLLGCCKGNLPQEPAQRFLQQKKKDSPIIVLTDLDLSRTCADRRIFYNVLAAGGLQSLLPRHAFVSRDGYSRYGSYYPSDNQQDEDEDDDKAEVEIVDRRDQLEINGKVLLKPVLERPVDPADPEVRVYYPRSHGGGCKILTFGIKTTNDEDDKSKNTHDISITAKFQSDVRHIRDNSPSSFIYEELADTPSVRKRRLQRKRDIVIQTLVPKPVKVHLGLTSPGSSDKVFGDDDQVSYESDLSRLDRKIFVVTTASLPWMTGTAVNPLLRAAYLKRGRPSGSVTLVLPWLEKETDQVSVYGETKFDNAQEQEAYVRSWLRDNAAMPEEADANTGIQIIWYAAQYVSMLGSIFPLGDICKLIPDEDADFCILEEPEHLNWFRPEGEGEIWTEKFSHVVGVIHTNYRSYASKMMAGLIAAPIISGFSTLMVRAYCDKVIKLSGTLQTYSPEKEVVCNVHGVRSDFLKEGKRRSEHPAAKTDSIAPAAYFIGKLLWEKGLDHLLQLEYFFKSVTGRFFPIDIVGDGPDRAEIEAAFHAETKVAKVAKTIRRLLALDADDTHESQRNVAVEEEVEVGLTTNPGTILEIPKEMQLQTGNIPGRFHGRKDHAEFCASYKVLVNPSVTEVLCTTVAEALAMGKFAVIPDHPSNEFFLQFPNCLAYKNKVEFVKQMAYALENEPEPTTDAISHVFTWEAATDRLIQASAITMKEARARAKARKGSHDQFIAKTYNKLGLGTQRRLMHLFFKDAVIDPGDKAVSDQSSLPLEEADGEEYVLAS